MGDNEAEAVPYLETPAFEQAMRVVDKFYELKSRYDQRCKAIRIQNNKARPGQTQQQPKCINCDRVGGTNFAIFLDETKSYFRTYKATCNATPPCALDLEAVVSLSYSARHLLSSRIQSIGELKQQIVQTKNDLIFRYDEESTILETFDKLSADIKGDIEEKNELALLVANDPRRQEMLKQKETEFGIVVQQMQAAVTPCPKIVDGKNPVDAAVAAQVEAQPLLNQIRDLKYRFQAVEVDNSPDSEDPGIFHLVQRRNGLMQWYPGEAETEMKSNVSGFQIIQTLTKRKRQETRRMPQSDDDEEEGDVIAKRARKTLRSNRSLIEEEDDDDVVQEENATNVINVEGPSTPLEEVTFP